LLEIEAERSDVGHQFLTAFLERHEDAGFVVEAGPAEEKLQGEESLAGAGAAADERGTPGRESAARNLIEAGNAGQFFLKTGVVMRAITTVSIREVTRVRFAQSKSSCRYTSPVV
jgi:hypothetical protein